MPKRMPCPLKRSGKLDGHGVRECPPWVDSVENSQPYLSHQKNTRQRLEPMLFAEASGLGFHVTGCKKRFYPPMIRQFGQTGFSTESPRSRRRSLIQVQRGARHQVDQAGLNHALPISDTNPAKLSAILSTDSFGAIPSKQTIGQGGEFPLRSKATSSPAPLLPNTKKFGAICS